MHLGASRSVASPMIGFTPAAPIHPKRTTDSSALIQAVEGMECTINGGHCKLHRNCIDLTASESEQAHRNAYRSEAALQLPALGSLKSMIRSGVTSKSIVSRSGTFENGAEREKPEGLINRPST
jgi:hypothetical protein